VKDALKRPTGERINDVRKNPFSSTLAVAATAPERYR
jgi:hypothetical protein